MIILRCVGLVSCLSVLWIHAAAGAAPPALVRETPHVWNVTPHQATIAWFTTGGDGEDTAATVEFGPTDAYGSKADAATRDWPLQLDPRIRHHVATLTGLEPATRYYYRVAVGGTALVPAGGAPAADYRFETAKHPTDHSPFTFAVLGDGGEGNKYQRAVTWQMEQQTFDFVLHTGDVVYDDGTDAEWYLNYYPIYRNLVRTRPWFLSLGNHEYLRAPAYFVVDKPFAVGGERLVPEETYQAAAKEDPSPLRFKRQEAGTASGYFENAVLPEGPAGEQYYSFDWGAVHVIVLDSNRRHTPGGPGDPAYQWLVDDLRRSTAPWKIVCFHHPMASIGKPEYAFTAPSAANLRRDWHPVFEANGVDLVFSGHDHNYQRTHPLVVDPNTGDLTRDDDNGVLHIVTGGGGSGLSDATVRPAPPWHTGVFHKRHHFLLVTADGETLRITALGDDNINTRGVTEKQGVGGPAETLDTVTLSKRGGTRRARVVEDHGGGS